MLEYTTGNEYVDKMAAINLTGNIIPQIWYKQIVRDNGKPHLLAITILSDIVYWYRPTELRDPATGAFKGYSKKFAGDLLQRSYSQLSEQFGESKRSVTEAVIRLEKLGVIERVFRTIEVGGILYNNVLYIKLIPEKLAQITYPEQREEEEIKEVLQPEEIIEETQKTTKKSTYVTPPTKLCDRGHIISGEVSQNLGRQNTKITTKNTTENISSSSKGDDDDQLRKRIAYEKVLQYCSEELVERIFQNIKTRKEVIEQMDEILFLRLCTNISQFSEGIGNMDSYISKCIDNILQAKAYITENRKTQFYQLKEKQKNKFLNFQQNDYDFEQLEKELLSN